MEKECDDRFLYPNRGETTSPSVSRRLLLAGSFATGVSALSGCSTGSSDETPSSGADSPTESVTAADSVFVFNTGDRTMSVVDVETDSVVATTTLGVTASFPANQFSPNLTDSAADPLWLNVDSGVRALRVGTLETATAVETGSGANWQELTPDGSTLVVSAREPAHTQVRVDADPDSDSFGAVTAELDRVDEGGRADNDGPGPCDVTIHPGGRYAYVPDLFGDTLTVLDIPSFSIANQIDVSSVVGDHAKPWMGTAAPDGETLLVEHDHGTDGSESVWDISEPDAPTERARLTAADGLGGRPLTSEIGPDSETGYVFTPGTDDVSVIDLTAGTVTDRLDLGGSAFVGTWAPNHEKLYVPVQSSDEIKVIDHGRGKVVETLAVGSQPYGATAGTVRPTDGVLDAAAAAGPNLRAELSGRGTTYCLGNCACGHQL